MCQNNDFNQRQGISFDKIDFVEISNWLKSKDAIAIIEKVNENEKKASEMIREMSYVKPEDLKIPYSL
jgi:hypothetical protein